MSVTQTWGQRFAARTAEARLLMTILLFFGGLAALLAALGVYGLFSWSVALRTRELAIRLTLGARPSRVGALVIGQSAVLVVVGVATGLVIIRLAESALARVVFGVTTSDAMALATASALLLRRGADGMRASGATRDAGGSGGGIASGVIRSPLSSTQRASRRSAENPAATSCRHHRSARRSA